MGNSSLYTINKGYSLKDFYYYRYTSNNNAISVNDFRFTINDPYNDKINLNNNELYTILFEIIEGSLIVNLDIEQIEPDDEEDFPTWGLVLIILGSLIIILIIIFLIIITIRKRKQIKNMDIEQILDPKEMKE